MTTIYGGLPACDCLAEWCAAFEARIGRQPHLFQLIGDAPASAHFHEGGGSADYETLSDAELRDARNMGGAAWNRWWHNPDGSTNYHCHIRLNGCTHNSIAQPQVDDLNKGLDGTGPLGDNSGTPDNGPRDGVQWPLRTYSDGINWAQQEADMQLTDTFEMTNADGSKRTVSVAEALSAPIYYGDVLHKQVAAESPANGPSTLSDADKDDIAARVAHLVSQKLGA